ncbi:MAG: flagellar basal body rod protein FlgC [Candidatus Latescibacteria bacterium 4484_7]|nr:MAG: flagellar basal body rod protein FlgC [Candidatus Latescibacteria bacterium 4484_7]RKZ06446.1 MAG: flagellar basal body rod protein FlgC [bacterium]
MGLFKTLEISAAGLSVQRMRLDVIAENLANVETTKTAKGEPYRKKRVVIKAVKDRARPAAGQMEFSRIMESNTGYIPLRLGRHSASEIPEGSVKTDDKTPFTLRYEPGHPDADKNGFVKYPNVNVIDEMVDMVTASRAYEANVTAIQTAKDMFLKAIEI